MAGQQNAAVARAETCGAVARAETCGVADNPTIAVVILSNIMEVEVEEVLQMGDACDDGELRKGAGEGGTFGV